MQNALNRKEIDIKELSKEQDAHIETLSGELKAAKATLEALKTSHGREILQARQSASEIEQDIRSKLDATKWKLDSKSKELELCMREKSELLARAKHLERENGDLRANETNLIALYKDISLQPEQSGNALDMLTTGKSLDHGRVFRSTTDVLRYRQNEKGREVFDDWMGTLKPMLCPDKSNEEYKRAPKRKKNEKKNLFGHVPVPLESYHVDNFTLYAFILLYILLIFAAR